MQHLKQNEINSASFITAQLIQQNKSTYELSSIFLLFRKISLYSKINLVVLYANYACASVRFACSNRLHCLFSDRPIEIAHFAPESLFSRKHGQLNGVEVTDRTLPKQKQQKYVKSVTNIPNFKWDKIFRLFFPSSLCWKSIVPIYFSTIHMNEGYDGKIKIN